MANQNQPKTEHFKTILDYLHLALRFLVAGFFPILVTAFIDPNSAKEVLEYFNENEILLFGFCCLCGITIYSIHEAGFDRWYYKRAIRRYVILRELPTNLHSRINADIGAFNYHKYNRAKAWFQSKFEWLCIHRQKLDPIAKAKKRLAKNSNTSPSLNMVCERILFELYTNSFRNPKTETDKFKAHKLEDRYAILAFLYCVAYMTFIVATWYSVEAIYFNIDTYGLKNFFNSFLPPYSLRPSAQELRIALSYLFVFFIIQINRRFGYRLVRREMAYFS